jgi:hypothetical protein
MNVDDTVGGSVEVPFAIGVEDGGRVTGTLALSVGEGGTSVLFPPTVGIGVEDEGTNVDVGPVSETVVFADGGKSGIDVGKMPPSEVDGAEVTGDSVVLTLEEGNKVPIMLVRPSNGPPPEDVVGVGVVWTDTIVDVPVFVSLEVSAVDVGDVSFAVDPGNKVPITLVRPSNRPPSEDVVGVGIGVGVVWADTIVDVPVFVSLEVSATDVGDVSFAVDPGNKVPITLVRPSNRPPLLEVVVNIDVVVTAPVGNKRIPDEEEVSASVVVGLCVRVCVELFDLLVGSSEVEVEE